MSVQTECCSVPTASAECKVANWYPATFAYIAGFKFSADGKMTRRYLRKHQALVADFSKRGIARRQAGTLVELTAEGCRIFGGQLCTAAPLPCNDWAYAAYSVCRRTLLNMR